LAASGHWRFTINRSTPKNARFFMDLLKTFNERYDGMNDSLQEAIRRPDAFTNVENNLFIDYFNLCAEEWLFSKDGYIHDAVWNAWENGHAPVRRRFSRQGSVATRAGEQFVLRFRTSTLTARYFPHPLLSPHSMHWLLHHVA
jgi:hypothetical protein